MGAITKYCANCAEKNIKHEFQDLKYGKFVRVMNEREKGGSKCTVCGNIISK